MRILSCVSYRTVLVSSDCCSSFLFSIRANPFVRAFFQILNLFEALLQHGIITKRVEFSWSLLFRFTLLFSRTYLTFFQLDAFTSQEKAEDLIC